MKPDVVKSLLIAVPVSLVFFLFFGLLTDVIPNRLFSRMSPVGILDWVFLVGNALLIGVYVGLRQNKGVCNGKVGSGGVLGFLGYGCALCNKLLVLLLGVSFVSSFFIPLQPILGILSLLLLGWAVAMQFRSIPSF